MSYYIESKTREGKFGLAGPYETNYRAQRIIDESYEVEAEVKAYPTKNLAKATRMWKEEKISEKGFTQGSKRIEHPQS